MKVDVVINVYGKPWQTLCTLKSLMKHSGQHIDKIYLIKEQEQPYNEFIDWIFQHFDNLIPFTPKGYSKFFHIIKDNFDYKNEQNRFQIRQQYGIEKSDKKFIFSTHNDVLYTGDIIGEMLELIGDSVGIGEIGQCWNCPAKKMNLCSGEKYYEWQPTYEEVMKLPLPYVRTNVYKINKNQPKPLPECRLNEWACLLNREVIMKECKPNGDSYMFGQADLDSGDIWFRNMVSKGYTFVDYRKNFTHCFWSKNSGRSTRLDSNLYENGEKIAKEYFEKNF